MIVQIFDIRNGDTKPTSILSKGEHIFGRGDLLQCNDQRVSRKHGVIEVFDDKATITSTHNNPCFYVAANSKIITILEKGVPRNLSEGDKFGLLSDQYWFRVAIIGDDDLNGNIAKIDFYLPSTEESPAAATVKLENDDSDVSEALNGSNFLYNHEDRLSNKRHHEDENNEEIVEKKPKVSELNIAGSSGIKIPPIKTEQSENNNEDVIEKKPKVDELNIASTSGIKKEIKTDIPPIKNEQSENASKDAAVVKKEQVSEDEDESKADLPKNNVDERTGKQNGAAAPVDDGGGPSGTQKKQRRDRCWYGKGCYRKNSAHRQQFSHFGDPDFDTDPEDDRPSCSFGGECYRRNPDHRRDYKHPSNQRPPTPQQPKKRRRKNKKVDGDGQKQKQTADESDLDDYDLDDPFIDDGSSDEYVYNSDDEESDSYSEYTPND